MSFFLAILLVLGACLMMAHQQMRQTALAEQRVEYRYLPLDLDTWLKEQQHSAFNVMNDMVSQGNGYCTPSSTANSPKDVFEPTFTQTPSPPPDPNAGLVF